MDKRELEIIREIMDKLSDEMEYGEDDFSERLGRKKPEVEVVKIEGVIPEEDEELSIEDELLGEPDSELDMEDMLDEESSPEDDLKRRLMKLRG